MLTADLHRVSLWCSWEYPYSKMRGVLELFEMGCRWYNLLEKSLWKKALENPSTETMLNPFFALRAWLPDTDFNRITCMPNGTKERGLVGSAGGAHDLRSLFQP